MRALLPIILFFLYGLQSFSQIAPSKYLVRFTDKQNTPYSINKPEEFLSQRAIDRRLRQGIDIIENDLPVDPAYVDSIAKTGAKIFNRSKWINSVTIQTTDSAVLEKIHTFSFVLSIENVAKMSSKGSSDHKIEQDFYRGNYFSDIDKNPENNAINYGPSIIQISMLGGTSIHNKGYLGEGLIIAILDAGFYKVDQLDVFDSLWINNRILGSKDFVNPGGNVFLEHTHGMNVLSIMGGYKPGHLVGAAPHAWYWLLRSEDTGSEYIIEEYNWVSAAEFADSAGVDIINSSLGYTEFWDQSQNHTYADMDGKSTPSTIGADIAASKGILVVNSAGNLGNSSWRYIIAPSDGFNVLCVGAVDNEKNYALFSSRGPSYDGRLKPNVCAMGMGTFVSSSEGEIVNGNGTSFSSPLIAGMAACLWQTKPDANVLQLIDAIERSSSQYYNPDTLLGYGIPDFSLAKIILQDPEIKDFDNDYSFEVYPNPFYDELFMFFKSNTESDYKLEIFNLKGQRVFMEENIKRKPGYNLHKITEINNLLNGIYVLRMISGGIAAEEKIIKFNNK